MPGQLATMFNAITVAVVAIIVLAVSLELTIYARWRGQLYSLYLDYYNRKTHPLVPEAWRAGGGGYTIDFWLEWKMFFSPVVPEMGDELIRKVKRQKAIVIGFYLPILAFFVWALIISALQHFHI